MKKLISIILLLKLIQTVRLNPVYLHLLDLITSNIIHLESVYYQFIVLQPRITRT